MKITDAISKLNAVLKDHGDIELNFYEGYFLTGNIKFEVQSDAPVCIIRFNSNIE